MVVFDLGRKESEHKGELGCHKWFLDEFLGIIKVLSYRTVGKAMGSTLHSTYIYLVFSKSNSYHVFLEEVSVIKTRDMLPM